MKRRFGMWIGIIFILIVGVSVTRMTKDFVVSKGVAASSILNVMDAVESGAALAGGAQGESAVKKEMEYRVEIPQAAGGGSVETTTEMIPEPTIAAAALEKNTNDSSEKVEAVAGMTGGPGSEMMIQETIAAAGPGVPYPESTVVIEEPAEAAPVADSEGVLAYSGEVTVGPAETVAADKSPKLEVIQETVKSPLDPVVETNGTVIESVAEEIEYMAGDFFDRFKVVEESSVKLWENTSTNNMVAYHMAAEQELVLWDYELNLIYDAIRKCMTREEAEELKHLELEWLKERDVYAEKIAAKSPMINSQKQNPAYIRAQAEKTKERCYWLVAEYEDLLNGN